MRSPSTRPGLLAALLLVLVLAVGALAGIAFDRMVLLPRGAIAGEAEPRPSPPSRGPREPGLGLIRGADDRYLDFIDRQLELTDEQRARIEQILRSQQKRVLEITRETRPRVQSVARETRAAIDEVLTPEQRARFEELRKRRDRVMERQHRRARPEAGAVEAPEPR